MGFNGKSLISVGVILFIFQIANFISIETITPELERAQVLAAIASLFSVVAAVELVKWTRATPGFFSFFKEVNFENYKFLYLVIIVSSLLNGLLVNLILSVINTTTAISVVTVFRFAVGDFLGAIAVIATLWIIFRTLIDTRLIVDPRIED